MFKFKKQSTKSEQKEKKVKTSRTNKNKNNKNESEKKGRKLNRASSFMKSKLKTLSAKLQLMIALVIIVTSVIIVSGIAATIPQQVNNAKKESVVLQGNILSNNLKTLELEAQNAGRRFAMEQTLLDAISSEEYDGIPSMVIAFSNIMWNKESDHIPDIITISDNEGTVISRLVYSDEHGMFQKMNISNSTLGNEQVAKALSGQTASGYSSNELSNLILNTAVPLKKTVRQTNNNSEEDLEELENEDVDEELDEDEENLEDSEETEEIEQFTEQIIGTVSLGYMLDNNKYVDMFKGDEDVEISVILNDERIATTLKDRNDERRINTTIDSDITEKFAEDVANVIREGRLYGKNYIKNYVPIKSGSSLVGVLEVAIEKANLTYFYLTMFLIIIAVTAITITITILNIKKTVINPINSLVEAADTLATGDVEVNLGDKIRDDEIGALTKSFKEMAANIRNQAELVQKIASGDLTIEVEPKSDKALIDNSLKNMIETNNILFSEIISSAEQVAQAAKQIAAGSQGLSQGTTEQAAAIEELSEAISQIAEKTKLNAENANKSNKLVGLILESAKQGSEDMNAMLNSVQEISKASSEISKVIQVIDDIAFQTNILALNAAVEAARAGEYGKGFAVVAEEVRSLAAKSANAVKETTTMIENSINKAKEGEDIATKTAQSFEAILEGVKQISTVISAIDSASLEQTNSITEVNQGVEQVSKVVQTNAATAEESAASSEEMSSQAETLKELISSKFKLKSMDGTFYNGENFSERTINTPIIDEQDDKYQDFGKY